MRRRSFIFGAVFLILLILIWVYFPVFSRHREMKMEQERMEKNIRELEAKIQTLLEEKNLLEHDPDYLEKVARKELGLVKPGEVVYKFVEETPEPARSQTGAGAGTQKKPAP